MMTWEELVCKAKELATDAGRKVSDVADVAKLKLKVAENEKAMRATLEALGRLLYDSRRSDAAFPEDTVEELLSQVDELTAANERLRAEIDNNVGKKTCLVCGKANAMDAVYCNGCGNKL